MSIKKVTQHPTQNEGLIFDRSQTGRVGYRLPKLDVPETPNALPAELLRTDGLDGVPEVSEVDVIRHFTRISTWNYSIDLGMYPLGSCTMKYNSRLNEKMARIGGFAGLHPLAPETESQGALELMYRLQEDLAEITGLPGVSLQPAAGAQGEMTGVMLIRAFLDHRDGEASKDRRVMLIPDSAHGTNPASAALAGFTVKTIHSTPDGFTDMDHLRQLCNEGGVAGLMLTNPNTVGIFEKNIKEICEVIHAAGGLVYMDGANMNALVGVARPGDMGVDVIHLNLHKTFSTPHGGGGPGCGPCCCTAELAPYLPVPRIIADENNAGPMSYRLEYNVPTSIGRVKAFYGNFGMMIRALSYIYTHGDDGLKEATETAVLNARYVSKRLENTFDKPFESDCMHEAIFSHKNQSKRGVVTLDIAKRLIDYGFHPMTVYFPLVVEGAMLIEPTESVGRADLDAFCDAMIDIDREAQEDPELVINAPHSTRIGRLDEASAARKPVLRWKPDMESMSQMA
ncbi:MAG: aminomethyl-transferring glycine dehydrogenase subunit GcvPB [Pyrinomonadaceae bacterium]|nr:aminomethyl-transferring glycine dehydrogenase subunit GcvPB [Pyrinomonadaceae bacterium]